MFVPTTLKLNSWNKKVSLPYFLFLICTVIALAAIVSWQAVQIKSIGKMPPVISQQTSCPPVAETQYFMNNFEFAVPLLLEEEKEQERDDARLNDIRSGITRYIEQKKSEGILHSASVYLRELKHDRYITFNENEKYHPASLMKVPFAMALLRQGDLHPGFLDEVIFVTEKPADAPGHEKELNYAPTKTVEAGKRYTIRELLNYLIVESDNGASKVLHSYVDVTLYTQLFMDLGMPSPAGIQRNDFVLTAPEYSRFMRVLFNAAFLSNENSDYALRMLSQSKFKEGILKGLPENIKAAHKFGEFGLVTGKVEEDYELHESAIIYLQGNPLLLTIMTKGKDKMQLPKVIAEITRYICSQQSKPAL
jgi:beta-lactamase class A